IAEAAAPVGLVEVAPEAIDLAAVGRDPGREAEPANTPHVVPARRAAMGAAGHDLVQGTRGVEPEWYGARHESRIHGRTRQWPGNLPEREIAERGAFGGLAHAERRDVAEMLGRGLIAAERS